MKLAVITRAGVSGRLESHSGCIQLERLMGHPSGDDGEAAGLPEGERGVSGVQVVPKDKAKEGMPRGRVQ